ncbi:MAG: T9SS C-terminal target domain-containing protein [Bacteroidetes bacterium]|nr:MAG: T9SS C-terminal target domain-containing protein [Bacteroidota bacterium]
MNKIRIAIATLLGIGLLHANAQTTKSINRKLPAYKTNEEIALSKERAKLSTPFQQTLNKAASLPDNMRYPGEFEESQAVMISWPYDGDLTDIWIDTSETFGTIWAKLADAIQQEVTVIIRVDEPQDTTTVINYMKKLGKPLTNYKFMLQVGDAFWMRDFGPHGFYYGKHDSLGFIDLKYYDGRDNDDVWPKLYGKTTNKPVFTSRINGEGGNLMTDGFGTVFFSSVFTETNTDGSIVSPPFTRQATLDSIGALFASKQKVLLDKLLCDGGTGHIDLYLKMIDEQTIMAAQYPSVITASDRQRVEDNIRLIATWSNIYNRPFNVYRVPHPTSDDGTYTNTTCPQMNEDARTFVNGVTVNKTFIFPSYSNSTSGNTQQLDSVKNLYRKIMPGYKLVDIDSRALSVLGGELHCITMQIPAENPVVFWHPGVHGFRSEFTNKFHILAKIVNRSGIASAKCMWRIKGTTTYNTLDLRDSLDFFMGDLVINGLTSADEVEYYLTATTNNGKTATKPITAPEGNFNIHFAMRTGADEQLIQNKNYLFGAYPNPANEVVNILFYAENAGNSMITVTDITGKVVKQIEQKNTTTGLNELKLNVAELNTGIYFYTYVLNGNHIATRKFVVSK